MKSQIIQKRPDGTLFVTAAVADDAVLAQLGNAEALDDYGNLQLFVESWCDEPTYVGALAVIQEFGLDDFPQTESGLEAEYESVHKLFDALDLDLTNKIIRQLNAASEVVQEGGVYSTGWDERSYGLVFSASAEEVESIKEAQQKKAEKEAEEEAEDMAKNAAAYSVDGAGEKLSCIRKALSHIDSVDFGHKSDDNVMHLNKASDILRGCGIEPVDVDLALKEITMHPEEAAKYIHGPSGRGTNLGARADLMNIADKLQHGTSTGELRSGAPKTIIVGGHTYQRIDDPKLVEAAKKKAKDKATKKKDKKKGQGTGNKTTGPQRTPKDLKGVGKCRAIDHDPKRPPAEQEWCTYDSHGNLRGRHSSKDKAVDHKLFLINMYWMKGKGRFRKDRPTNKPVKNLPKRKK